MIKMNFTSKPKLSSLSQVRDILQKIADLSKKQAQLEYSLLSYNTKA